MQRVNEQSAIATQIATFGPIAALLSVEIHSDPELSLEERRAAQRLRSWLESEGFVIESPVAGLDTAFVAHHGSGYPNVAYLLEYDALPELGHACGHNLIAAGGALAAIALCRAFPDHSGTVTVIGTPGEEAGGGKVIELDHGVFNDVDVAMMFHPADRTLLWRHALAAGELNVEFHGKAAHAAKNPEEGRNALAAMLLFFNATDALRQHIGDKARIHGIITNGGTAPNVVPDFTAAEMLVRDSTSIKAEALIERVKQCAEGAALATGTTASLSQPRPLYSERKNNKAMAYRLADYLEELGVAFEEPNSATPAGSSDIGNVSLVVPTIHPYLQVAPRGTPSHSKVFQEFTGGSEAQASMLQMAEALANLGADALMDPALMEKIRLEFDESEPDVVGGMHSALTRKPQTSGEKSPLENESPTRRSAQ